MYKPIKRSLSRISASSLPLDLYIYPTMLALLVVCSPVPAVLLSVALLALYAYLHRVGGGAREYRRALGIALGSLVLYLVLCVALFRPTHALTAQLIWLTLAGLYGAYATITGHHTIEQSADSCGSARLLLGVRRQCYRRFARVLCLFALAFGSLVAMLLYLGVPEWVQWWLALGAGLASVGIVLLDLSHLVWVQTRQGRDYWIPVLDNCWRKVGRIASIDPKSSAGRLPLVRLMALSGDMIYLEQCPSQRGARYDTPFYTWLREGESPTDSAQSMIDSRFCGVRRATPRQLLRYHTQGECGQALGVYFFAVEIESPDLLLVDCKPIEGKWWQLDHVAHMLSQDLFSHYLQSELPYLEQTALLARKLRGRTKDNA